MERLYSTPIAAVWVVLPEPKWRIYHIMDSRDNLVAKFSFRDTLFNTRSIVDERSVKTLQKIQTNMRMLLYT